MIMCTPYDRRLGLIQNPAEIDVTEHDENGILLRDMFSLEAQELDEVLSKKPSSATFQNLQDHSMRMSPGIYCFGEVRSDKEFALSFKAGNTGHVFYTSLHSHGAVNTINRFSGAVMGDMPNASEDLVKENVCNCINLVITQQRMNDGTRKVISIDEICGVKRKNGTVEPIINPLFEFLPDLADEQGDRDNQSDGKIKGRHYLVGKLSYAVEKRLVLAGMSRKEYKILSRGAEAKEPIAGTYERSEFVESGAMKI
jgi:hypothetical protein